jgi:hypothetical protein
MTLTRIFLLCFVAGVAAGYLLRPPAGPVLVETASEPAIIDAPSDVPPAPLVATREPDERAEQPEPPDSPTPAPPAAPPAPAPAAPAQAAPALAALESELAKADALAAEEPLKAEDVRALLEQVLAGRLPRELSPQDYDRLTDAVMRVRAAERVLSGVDETEVSAELRAEQRLVLNDATSEVERITGVELGELSKIVDPQDGVADEGDAGRAGD